MRRAAKRVLIAALACAVFACWGMFTQGGARHFDEMDGMVPFFAGVGTAVLLLAAGGLLLAAGKGS
jgi:hypothetical protein